MGSGSRDGDDPMKKLTERLRALAEKAGRSRLNARDLKRAGALAGEIEALFAENPSAGESAQTELPGLSGEGAIRIWCDGSCAPNPGPGGWGAIVEQDGNRIELSGGEPASTNNIMEMTAAIEALKQTPEKAAVHITTDSRYLMDGITRWISGWKRKGWRKADGKPVLNQPVWRELDALQTKRRVTWDWVRGHSGHPENERCDELANRARKNL